jgi:hypothetical protein
MVPSQALGKKAIREDYEVVVVVVRCGREKRRKGREHGAGPRYLLTSWPLTTRIW